MRKNRFSGNLPVYASHVLSRGVGGPRFQSCGACLSTVQPLGVLGSLFLG